jgi:6-phosphogluconolactonase
MASSHYDLKIVQDNGDLAKLGAEFFLNRVNATLKERSFFTFVASGGTTPRALYEVLASRKFRSMLPWEKIHVFLGDERNVLPNRTESNFHLLWSALLSKVPLPETNIHRVQTELRTPQDAAQKYEDDIRTFFDLKEPKGRPCFDLIFLGLGTDGHTASLFSDGDPSVSMNQMNPNRLVIAPWVTHLNDYRISLTPTALNYSKEIVFLVKGKDKAPIVHRVLDGIDSKSYPAQFIRPENGKVTWLVDTEAAALLSREARLLSA